MRKIRLFLKASVQNKLYLKQLLPLILFLFSVNVLFAQTAGDFQTNATGNWSDTGIWQTYNGSAWVAATAVPDLTQAITITIQSGNTITVDAAYTTNNAALNIVVNGYLKETSIITKTAGIWTINGTYELNHASASGQGLPTATWNDGSTCSITGLTGASTGINATQSFYNLIFNCPNMTASINLGWSTGTITIRGNVTASNTGSGRWQWCAPAAGTSGALTSVTVNVGGNLVIDGSAATSAATGVSVTSNGTSNNYTSVAVNISGNVTVTGNSPANNTLTNFSISRGSQGGTGTSVWTFMGDVNVSNAQMQNSNAGGGKWVFAKTGNQTITLSNIYNTTLAPINMEVSAGSTLNIGNSALDFSSGFFTLDPGAGIITSHASGLNGNLTTTGTKTLSTAANYSFSGSSAQVTGLLLPTTVYNLTINNASGVSLSAPAIVNGVLALRSGTLSLGANNLTVASSGSISGASSTNYVVTDGSGTLTQSFVSSPLIFPIGASIASYDPATVTPTTATNVAVNVGSTLPAVAPTDYSYNSKVWNITPTSPSSTRVTLTPSTAVATIAGDVIAQYISGSYVNAPATRTGTGYTATFTTFAPFVTGTTDLGTSISQTRIAGVYFDGLTIHNAAKLNLRVYDATGRMMVSSVKDINMSSSPKGVYVVKSTSGSLKIVL